jgi:cytosine/creatinine deaminase
MDNYLAEAINQAKKSRSEGGIPIGSVLVYKNEIIGKGHNHRVQKSSVILHAEMDALENAGRQSAEVYKECILYTTLSPCPMCSGAILLYGIPKIIVGENSSFRGSEDLLKEHHVEVVVLNNKECIDLMQDFINKNPGLWNEDIGR